MTGKADNINLFSFQGAPMRAFHLTWVAFFICFFGLGLGKKFGTIFANKATIAGGIILIVIGLEIFITGIF